MPPSPATPVWILGLTVTHTLRLEFIDTLFKHHHELIYQDTFLIKIRVLL